MVAGGQNSRIEARVMIKNASAYRPTGKYTKSIQSDRYGIGRKWRRYRRRYVRCAVQPPEQRSWPERPLQRPLPEDVVSLPEPEADLPAAETNTRT